MCRLGAIASAVTAIALISPVGATDPRLPVHPDTRAVSIAKRTWLDLYLTSREAAVALARHSDMLLLDVRPATQIATSGAPALPSVHIPLLVPTSLPREPGAPAMQVDPAFVDKVKAILKARQRGRGATIIVLCSVGLNAVRAADLLAEAGHVNVYTVVDGYDGGFDVEHSLGGKGWRNERLPVTVPSPPPDPASQPGTEPPRR